MFQVTSDELNCLIWRCVTLLNTKLLHTTSYLNVLCYHWQYLVVITTEVIVVQSKDVGLQATAYSDPCHNVIPRITF